SDLREVISHTNDIFDAWAAHDKEYFRGKTNNGIPWWQTVHTSIYDISNRTLRVAVQETDDWYTFAVPSTGGVKPDTVREIVEPMIGAATNGIPEHLAALQSGKRDLTDRRCFHTVFVLPPDALPITGGEHDGIPYDWSSYSISDNGELLDATGVEAGSLSYWNDKDSFVWSGGASGLKFGGKEPIADEFPTAVKRITSVDNINVIANRDRDAKNALAKFDAFGNLVAAFASDIPHDATKLDADDPVLTATDPSVDASATSLAGAKATGEALANKADKFTAWEFSGSDVAHYTNLTLRFELVTYKTMGWVLYDGDENITGRASDDPDRDLVLDLNYSGNPVDIIATRRRVLRTGDAATPQELVNATNDVLVAAKEYTDAHGGDVQSVNGKTGTVVLEAADVRALPDTYTPPAETDPVWTEQKAGYVPWANAAHNAVTIGTREAGSMVGYGSFAQGNQVNVAGIFTHAQGIYTHAEGNYTHAEGVYTHAEGAATHAEGGYTHAEGDSTHAEGGYTTAGKSFGNFGMYAHAAGFNAQATNVTAFTWNGSAKDIPSTDPTSQNYVAPYGDHGNGTYNLNPAGGLRGLWVGETNMADHIANLAPRYTPAATDPTFSNAVFNATANSPHLDPVVL
ncbi:MAG: hypothetical protein KBT68_08470, partial [bacterium]|nr:hypothetical protein [Candidatus Colisoma equi]